jgi:hypothetical protein
MDDTTFLEFEKLKTENKKLEAENNTNMARLIECDKSIEGYSDMIIQGRMSMERRVLEKYTNNILDIEKRKRILLAKNKANNDTILKNTYRMRYLSCSKYNVFKYLGIY